MANTIDLSSAIIALSDELSKSREVNLTLNEKIKTLEEEVASLKVNTGGGQGDSEDLLNRISVLEASAVKDTGWYNITDYCNLPPNITYSSADMVNIYLRRIGNIVYLQFSNFGWSAASAFQNWLKPEVTHYIRPPVAKIPRRSDGRIFNTQLRGAGIIGADNREMILFYYDWLGPTNLRMASNRAGLVTHGMCSWITDTPFPSEDQLVGVKEKSFMP